MSIQQRVVVYVPTPVRIEEIHERPPITRSIVREDQRLGFFPKYAGEYFLQLEAMIFQTMDRLCPDYNGGMWTMWELSNGGCYLSPALPDDQVRMVCEGNCFEGKLSTDAAGIVVSLVAINHLAWSVPDPEHFNTLFYALRDWAIEHPESEHILRAID
ncbi:antirestriction protein [Haliea sp.]|jgi:hypothetical protein|uniref:antirestriction protein n=1 Tax=Haliea sp. TaxID=1932666 RepID=UPI000C5496B6|nr:antirestriction protein [Haliea sp.]HBX74442.1 antirestriction protein [Halieaceae bacterium]MAD65528.1 antirestriction protein [Haliea sp.]MAY91816.1 antirestriction protein [Haliea sp.]MBK40256.1 antirestriction protein [Haliea sp.]MBP68851.1 antirestriction protein [Haliea sp.]|tara:strand:- start:10193 stop:10666 length:474 start_codon:yes stop_codon:yes gene_type:complete